ncbi:DUF3500-domain-containing protein [Aspergillus terreus]|uniref:DUF3500-domain-containing protein n=1 Tax=Aspergillus terreus TaxID=33178 RepID=A0A5M3ZEC6_ASPTE|nr:hypothetical protein ATETN484_0013000300 [Aspergillus terreus]GFF21846.1 DUF3500-domain-containing protein [Aspergillus terreus]
MSAHEEHDFRRWLPEANKHPYPGFDTKDVYEFSKNAAADPRVSELFQKWSNSLKKPFFGITADGTKIEGLYALENQGAPTTAAAVVANKLLDKLTIDETQRTVHDLNSEDWRKWCNTEIIAYDVGIRLEVLEQTKIDLIWELVKASLSERGYRKVRGVTKINHFLGILADKPAILNENSYSFMICGRPSAREPWSFSLSGHHLCLHVTFIGEQMTIGPAFIGCEPDHIDEGLDKGVELFRSEIALPMQLMQSLTPEQKKKAIKSSKIHEPENVGWNIVDQRHLGGTGQDNRVIPYEGIVASELTSEQVELLVSVVAVFSDLLPAGPHDHYLRLVRKHLSETYLTWTGGFRDRDPYYVRIQSPVALVELDHHSGIYLTNESPGPYHIHNIMRLPNGNDYGRELIRQWKQSRAGRLTGQPMKYIRPLNEEETIDTGFPKYKAQILSCLESAIILASRIGEGGCGPGLHYHHSDQFYFLAHGSMTVRLGEQEHDISEGSVVFIPAGLPHCNWNNGPGAEIHLEMIVPAPHRLKQLAYMIEKPEDVPKEWRTTSKGYIRHVERHRLLEPLPGFKIFPLADPSTDSHLAMVIYAEVAANAGGPSTHIHEFDQYYFVLEGELTIEVALQKHVVPADTLVVLPAGVPHRQYNQAPGRLWDYGVNFTPTGKGHYGDLNAAAKMDDRGF